MNLQYCTIKMFLTLQCLCSVFSTLVNVKHTQTSVFCHPSSMCVLSFIINPILIKVVSLHLQVRLTVF